MYLHIYEVMYIKYAFGTTWINIYQCFITRPNPPQMSRTPLSGMRWLRQWAGAVPVSIVRMLYIYIICIYLYVYSVYSYSSSLSLSLCQHIYICIHVLSVYVCACFVFVRSRKG